MLAPTRSLLPSTLIVFAVLVVGVPRQLAARTDGISTTGMVHSSPVAADGKLTAATIPHPFLRRSRPEAAEIFVGSPKELRLTFSEPIELRFTRLELLGPGGASVPLGQLTVVPDSLGTILSAIPGVLMPGPYQVVWQAAGSDAHVVRGEFSFTVSTTKAADGQAVTGNASTQGQMNQLHDTIAQAFDASHPLFAGTRWLMYLALLGIIGAAVFQRAVLRRVAKRCVARGVTLDPSLASLAAGIGWAAAILLLVSLPLRLAAQGVAMHSPGEGLEAALIVGMLFHTVWGWSWLVQLGLGVMAVAAFGRARSTGRWSGIGTIAVLLAFTPAFAGHAIGAERFTLVAVLADGTHVFAAASWLGTLTVMFLAGILAALTRDDHGLLAQDLVTSFSPVALIAVSGVVLSGALSAWIHISHLTDLWTTTYGQVLLLKLGVMAVAGGTGAYNWRRVLPRLGDRVGAVRILRSASLEVFVAVLVLFVTAVLVALPTPLAAHGP